MSEELKPIHCPFCRSDLTIVSSRTINGWKFVYCQDCLAEGPAKDDEAEAIAAWNRRAQDVARSTLTDEQRKLINEAIYSITQAADGIKAGCACGDEWPDADDKAFYDAELALVDRLRSMRAALATAPIIPAECDVRKILLRVVPGDGDGLEIYAKNVAEVEKLLCEMGERLEDFESRATAPTMSDSHAVAWENPSTHAILRDESPDMGDLRRREWRALVYRDAAPTMSEADKRDAQRYRFIKSQMQVGAVQTKLPLYRTLHWIGYEDCNEVRDADAAVDAAIDRANAEGEKT